MFKNILLANDGEDHSRKAIDACLEIAGRFQARVTVIHVLDPYLKQFYNEIYAQGRKEYLEHVDYCLKIHSDSLEKDMEHLFKKNSISFSFIRRYGDPETEILAEAKKRHYDLLIMGGKILTGLQRFTSWNLPTKIETACRCLPVMICRQ